MKQLAVCFLLCLKQRLLEVLCTLLELMKTKSHNLSLKVSFSPPISHWCVSEPIRTGPDGCSDQSGWSWGVRWRRGGAGGHWGGSGESRDRNGLYSWAEGLCLFSAPRWAFLLPLNGVSDQSPALLTAFRFLLQKHFSAHFLLPILRVCGFRM